MSTLKMVLHVEKTLKTTIQKKLPKSQKFVRRIIVAEFSYCQTIFFVVQSNFISLQFGRKNNEQRAKSNEQRAESNEQRVKTNEQEAKSNEQRAKSNKQKVTSNEQPAKDSASIKNRER